MSSTPPSLRRNVGGLDETQAGTSVAVGGFLLARAAHNRKKALSAKARRSDHTDEYFGEIVADPYRWMESE